MNHNAEEIKTSAVVQCLFRLTAAPFLIKMGLGRPFRASPLFILHCPHPFHLHLHTQAPSFILSHGRSHTHTRTHRIESQTHIASHAEPQPHTQPSALTHSHTDASKRANMTTSLHPGTQAHVEPPVTHSRPRPVSYTHIKLQSVTHTVSYRHEMATCHTHVLQSHSDTQRQPNQNRRTHTFLAGRIHVRS